MQELADVRAQAKDAATKNGGRIAKICVMLAFLAMLLVGVAVFDDYGLSCDEIIERQSTAVNYRYVNRVLFDRDVFSDIWPTALSEYRDRYYGVTMQLPMILAEDVYAQVTGVSMPSRTSYLMRHLYTFLIYWFALICFYQMLRRLFESRWLALTGVLLVYLFGQFFAHSFYNIKDLLFASLLMIALSCAERVFATDRKPVWCALFAVASALLVTSRIIGALLIVLVLGVMATQDVVAAKRAVDAAKRRGIWKRLLPYILICCAYPVWIVLTPAAWSNPIAFSLGYVKTFANYQDPTAAAQAAKAVAAGATIVKNNTRFYFIRHIALSVPVVNQALCVLGVAVFVGRGIHKKAREPLMHHGGNAIFVIMFCLLAGTLLVQAIFQPNVYGGWRHGFFLYPLICAFAVYALAWIVRVTREKRLRFVRYAVFGCVAASLLFNAARIVKNHPYEYAMGNIPGRRSAVARERDYWRSTYYDLTKYVLEDEPGVARVCILDTTAGKRWIVDLIILTMLDEKDATRLDFDYIEKSNYVLQNYANSATNDCPIEGFEEVYAIWVDEMKIAAVMKRTNPLPPLVKNPM